MVSKPVIIGIAGGAGSGKTSIAHYILNKMLKEKIGTILLEQDSYYKSYDELPFEERIKLNYDHPDSIDVDLFTRHLNDFIARRSINKPIYNYSKYTREEGHEVVKPEKLIIIEGILILAMSSLRNMLDVKIFIDTDDDERLLRRIERDMKDRGRSFESIKNQYIKTVKPMHLEFVEPSKRYADIIIPRGAENKIAINMVISRLKHLVK